jgi:hypothetical protein
MTNILNFPTSMPTPQADHEQIATYGGVGALSVNLIRLPTIRPTLISVAVSGPPEVGLKVLTSLPDSGWERGFADVIGGAVLQALEMAEAAQGAPPEAC